MWSTWASPTAASISYSNNEVLTKEQVESWREKGYTLVDGLLPSELCDEVYSEAYNKLSKISDNCDFGSDGMMEYPCGLNACDDVTLHLNILRAAAQLLGIQVKDLRLTQSDIWMKLGKETSTDKPLDNNNQRVHCGKTVLITALKYYLFCIFYFQN
jgi:hypothetical protein